MKKILSFIFVMVLIIPCALVFSACDGKKGIAIFDKEFTIDNKITYTMYKQGSEYIEDPVAWINQNFANINWDSSTYGDSIPTSASEYLNYINSTVSNATIGAKLTIGSPTGDDTKTAPVTLTLKDNTSFSFKLVSFNGSPNEKYDTFSNGYLLDEVNAPEESTTNINGTDINHHAGWLTVQYSTAKTPWSMEYIDFTFLSYTDQDITSLVEYQNYASINITLNDGTDYTLTARYNFV